MLPASLQIRCLGHGGTTKQGGTRGPTCPINGPFSPAKKGVWAFSWFGSGPCYGGDPVVFCFVLVDGPADQSGGVSSSRGTCKPTFAL